jgi:probable rRNA maturation factor
MIEIYNNCKFQIDKIGIENIKNDLTSKHVELLIVGKKYMKDLNFKFKNIDKATDVLSFPLEQTHNVSLGSIVICLDVAKKAAKSYKHNINDEISLLFIHGMLHLLGLDHQKDNGEMRQKEHQLIKKHRLPTSLIIRTEEFL